MPTDDEKVRPSQNPEGDVLGARHQKPAEGHNVTGDEAEAAGERATADEPVDRQEIHDQSAYKDASADVGQQAASAEREREDEE
jgi:hypothetical protein